MYVRIYDYMYVYQGCIEGGRAPPLDSWEPPKLIQHSHTIAHLNFVNFHFVPSGPKFCIQPCICMYVRMATNTRKTSMCECHLYKNKP